MGPEINIDSILALEKQIEEGLGDVTQLKRAQNSLLNITTRVPPELLGQVFRWNTIPVGDHGRLEKGSYNFLLVCHHWFEVASGTPELWTHWGNNLNQWSRRYQRSGAALLDPVLLTDTHDTVYVLDEPLRDALRDRVAHDSIRSIYLEGWNGELLESVISSLTLDGEGIRDSSIESLWVSDSHLDVSKFLARYRFPKLRVLHISTATRISPWDKLKIQATSLTSLCLGFYAISNNPTTSQLLSILTSNPNLQDLSLYQTTIPHDGGDGSTFRVPLRRLKKLQLTGDCRHIFQLLRRLEYPDALDLVDLELRECVEEMVSELLEPYLRDRLQHDARFRGRLGVRVCRRPKYISLEVDTIGTSNIPTTQAGHNYPSMSFSSNFTGTLPQDVGEELCVNLITLTPREHVVGFTGDLDTDTMADLFVTMPNIENLSFVGRVDFGVFLQPDPPSRTKLLPSLRRLYLDYFTLQEGSGWTPLINYLTHQTSGGQVVSLRLRGRDHPPPEVVKEIQNLAEEFNVGYPSEGEWH